MSSSICVAVTPSWLAAAGSEIFGIVFSYGRCSDSEQRCTAAQPRVRGQRGGAFSCHAAGQRAGSQKGAQERALL
jgi:hypothetical protein